MSANFDKDDVKAATLLVRNSRCRASRSSNTNSSERVALHHICNKSFATQRRNFTLRARNGIYPRLTPIFLPFNAIDRLCHMEV